MRGVAILLFKVLVTVGGAGLLCVGLFNCVAGVTLIVLSFTGVKEPVQSVEEWFDIFANGAGILALGVVMGGLAIWAIVWANRTPPAES